MDTEAPYEIITRFSTEQEQELQGLFDLQPISRGRSLEEIRALIKHSDLIIGCQAKTTGRLVGCGRALSDYFYKAWIFDVRVAEDHRGNGVGKAIIKYILQYPDFQRVKHFELICRPETAGFYTKLGFSSVLDDREYLRLTPHHD